MTEAEPPGKSHANEKPERPGYRFPVVASQVVEVPVRLAPFAGAPDGFAGSLDALLEHLQDGSVALRSLPLAPLIEQYLGFLEGFPHESADTASDFLQLAATLIHLKSQLLAPLPPAALQGDVVREEIVRQIVQQERRRREAAAGSAGQAWEEADETPERLSLLDLMVLLQDVQTRLRSPLSIAGEDFTVEQAIAWLRAALPAGLATAAECYFDQQPTTREKLVAFLAILELIRTRSLDCHQTEAFAPLWLWPVESNGTASVRA